MLNSIPVAQLMVKTHVPLEGMMQERGKKKIIIIIIYSIPLVKTVLIMITAQRFWCHIYSIVLLILDG